jgi:hypothetical protein
VPRASPLHRPIPTPPGVRHRNPVNKSRPIAPTLQAQLCIGLDDTPTGYLVAIRVAMRPLRKLYRQEPAARFGPLALRAVQQAMVQSGLARGCVNHRVQIIKAMFRWAVSLEMLPPSIHHALATVPGLRAGRSAAKETAPVSPSMI